MSETEPRFKKLLPPFKSKKNQWYTAVLFYERWSDTPMEDRVIDCQFSLYGGIPGVIDCKSTFIQEGDPTGYKWAMKYLGSWDHWERLLRAPWFLEAVETWVKELKVSLKSAAIQTIQEIAQNGSPQSLPASKYLARAEWDLELNNRGRPSKEVLRGKLNEAVRVLEEEKEDMRRIGLTLVQGGKS